MSMDAGEVPPYTPPPEPPPAAAPPPPAVAPEPEPAPAPADPPPEYKGDSTYDDSAEKKVTHKVELNDPGVNAGGDDPYAGLPTFSVRSIQSWTGQLQEDSDNAATSTQVAAEQVEHASEELSGLNADDPSTDTQYKAAQQRLNDGLNTLAQNPTYLDPQKAQLFLQGTEALAGSKGGADEALGLLAQVKASGDDPNGLKAQLSKNAGASSLKSSYNNIFNAAAPAYVEDQLAIHGKQKDGDTLSPTAVKNLSDALVNAADPSLIDGGQRTVDTLRDIPQFVAGDGKGTGTQFQGLRKELAGAPAALRNAFNAGVALKREDARLLTNDLKRLDGNFFSSDGKRPPSIQKYDASRIGVDFLAPVQPNGPASGRTVIHVNGIGTEPGGFVSELTTLSNGTGDALVGIYNATDKSGIGLGDIDQTINDKIRIGNNPAHKTLVNVINDELAAGEKLNLSGYSHGAIIVGRALHDVNEKLEREGKDAKKILDNLDVETFGGAETNFVDGPRYVHNINDHDFVPGDFGLGPETNVTNLFKHPGDKASVRVFADRGDINQGAIGPHLLDSYLRHRKPFEQGYAEGPGYHYAFNKDAYEIAHAESSIVNRQAGNGLANAEITSLQDNADLSPEYQAHFIAFTKGHGEALDVAVKHYFAKNADGSYKNGSSKTRETLAKAIANADSHGQFTAQDATSYVKQHGKDAEKDAWRNALIEAGLYPDVTKK